MDKLSNGFQSLFTAAKNIATGVDQYVDDSTYSTRLETCMSCPKLLTLTNQCGECLCFVKLKTKLKQESCPLLKWEATKTEE